MYICSLQSINFLGWSLSCYDAVLPSLSLSSFIFDVYTRKLHELRILHYTFRVCTNSSSWTEQILSLDRLPDSISEDLRRVYDVLTRTQSSGSTFSLESLLENPSDESSRRTNMIKFVRNAALLCLKSIPGNYILQESVLVAEELSQSRMNSSSGSVTPCRSLAKCLLKSDRQVFL